MCYSYIRKQAAQQESVDRNATTAGHSDTATPASDGRSDGHLAEPAYATFLADLKALFADPARRRKETAS